MSCTDCEIGKERENDQTPPLLNNIKLNELPAAVALGDSVKLSGGCEGAHHVALHITGSGVDIWRKYAGQNFEDSFTPTVIGTYTFQLYARNTLRECDYNSVSAHTEPVCVSVSEETDPQISSVSANTASGYYVQNESVTIAVNGKNISNVYAVVYDPNNSIEQSWVIGDQNHVLTFTPKSSGEYRIEVQADNSASTYIATATVNILVEYVLAREYIKNKDIWIKDNHIDYVNEKITVCGIPTDIQELIGAENGYSLAEPSDIDVAYCSAFPNGINNIVKRYNLKQLTIMYPDKFEFNIENVDDNSYDANLQQWMVEFRKKCQLDTDDMDIICTYLQQAAEGTFILPEIPQQVITPEVLAKLGFVNISDNMVNDLNRAIEKYIIDGCTDVDVVKQRERHFFAQCMEESGKGACLTEAGYLSAQKQMEYCSKYDYRIDLGNNDTGMGYRYRGAGYIQVTGYSNYAELAKEVGDQKVMDGADYVAANYAWTAAGFWWHNNNINAAVDEGASVLEISKMVNAGPNARYWDFAPYNIEVREKCYNLCLEVI